MRYGYSRNRKIHTATYSREPEGTTKDKLEMGGVVFAKLQPVTFKPREWGVATTTAANAKRVAAVKETRMIVN